MQARGGLLYCPFPIDPDTPDQMRTKADVLGDRQVGDEIDFLRRDGDACRLGVDRRVEYDLLVVTGELAAGRRELAAENIHQRALASSVLANNGVNLAGGNPDRHIPQGVNDTEGF